MTERYSCANAFCHDDTLLDCYYVGSWCQCNYLFVSEPHGTVFWATEFHLSLECANNLNNNISQGSEVIYLRCGGILITLLQIYSRVYRLKNFENHMRFDWVTAMSLVSPFFIGHADIMYNKKPQLWWNDGNVVSSSPNDRVAQVKWNSSTCSSWVLRSNSMLYESSSLPFNMVYIQVNITQETVAQFCKTNILRQHQYYEMYGPRKCRVIAIDKHDSYCCGCCY